MAKYLIEASYTLEGLKGIMKTGGTARRASVQQAAESVGGKLEVQYFALATTTRSPSSTCRTTSPQPRSRSR